MERYLIHVKNAQGSAEISCVLTATSVAEGTVTFTVITNSFSKSKFTKLLRVKKIPLRDDRTLEIKKLIRSLFAERVVITISEVRKKSISKSTVRKVGAKPLLKSKPGAFKPPEIDFALEDLEEAYPNAEVASNNASTVEDRGPDFFFKLQRPQEPEEEYITYDILYGTNRARQQNAKDINSTFDTGNQHALEVGLCQVSIPLKKKHKAGTIERPGWFEDLLFGESPKKHMVLLNVQKKQLSEFTELLKEKVQGSEEGDVLLFIHGFNNTYPEAMRRAAQLGYDLNFKGAVMAYSWPSKGTVKGYLADSNEATVAAKYLKEFLEVIVADNGVKKIHIIAHSMGNVVLTGALLQLKNYPLPEINQIVLAAPDIDQVIFIQDILPRIYRELAPPRITLYASSNDKALRISAKIREEQPRVGMGGEQLLIVKGIDSIDASDVDTNFLGHGYFAETKVLIDDLFLVLKGLPPNERILDKFERLINGIAHNYWTLRR